MKTFARGCENLLEYNWIFEGLRNLIIVTAIIYVNLQEDVKKFAKGYENLLLHNWIFEGLRNLIIVAVIIYENLQEDVKIYCYIIGFLRVLGIL